MRRFELLQKAITIDPSFAKALAFLSYRQQYQAFLGDQAYMDLAMENAGKALAIDPNLADAHFSLASAYWIKGRTFHSASVIPQNLELDPNS